METVGKNYTRTIVGCFFGISNQAVITNITAVLFVHFMNLYDFRFWQLGVLVGVNFAVQLAADIVLTFLVDRIGFRPLVMAASGISTIGLLLYGSLPFWVSIDDMFPAMLLTAVIFAFSSGMCEALLSPIVDNIPETEKSKGSAMSLMHSFYAWGQVFCVVATALFLKIAGSEKWGFAVIFFAFIPAIALALFSKAPIEQKAILPDKSGTRKILTSPFFIVALLAIFFGGAAEVVMNQWVSTFLVKGLRIDKTTADLLGMSFFAAGIGLGRLIHGKFGDRWSLSRVMIAGSFFSFALYLVTGLSQNAAVSFVTSVALGFTASLLWPGTLSVASRKFPQAGAWLFTVLAIAGDTGAAILPAAAGFISENAGLNIMLICMSLAPLGALFCHLFLSREG